LDHGREDRHRPPSDGSKKKIGKLVKKNKARLPRKGEETGQKRSWRNRLANSYRSPTCYTNLYTSWCVAMPTNLAIDDSLIEEARRIGRHQNQEGSRDNGSFGIHRSPETSGDSGFLWHGRFDPKYDYKSERKQEALGAGSRRHQYFGLSLLEDTETRNQRSRDRTRGDAALAHSGRSGFDSSGQFVKSCSRHSRVWAV